MSFESRIQAVASARSAADVVVMALTLEIRLV